MTECERIIKNNVLPRSFFDEEIRCDFLVTKERKKIWAIGLDLLLEFDRVCKKYNLSYFLIHGSLLGAIRHNGFIPWDDDIDVAMLRSDYNNLMNIAAKEFSNQYFFQTPYSDNGYLFSFNKLRNKNTTGISLSFRYESFNQGLFLDIFPLDNCLLDDAEKRFNQIKDCIIDNSNYMRRKSLDSEDQKRYLQHSGKDPLEVVKEIERIQTMHEKIKDTEYVNNSSITTYPYEKLIFKRDSFSSSIMHEFEGFKFPIPIGWEEILKNNYGNYLQMPAKEDRGKWHDKSIMNADIPYKQFAQTYYVK